VTLVPRVDACLIDLDGTLYQADRAIPGAANTVAKLRAAGIVLRFTTNTTRRPRRLLAQRLAALGIPASPDELHTAPLAAARWLETEGARRLMLLLAEDTVEEFAGFVRDHDGPDHVVVGDLGEAWTYEVLDHAFRALRRGARLVAIQKNRWWDAGDGPRLDAGPFVAALEFATGREAVLVGKPSPAFFAAAADGLGLIRNRIAVVGDNVETDIRGAHAVGCLGIAVRTGSFREADLVDHPADAVLDSIADLPHWLGI